MSQHYFSPEPRPADAHMPRIFPISTLSLGHAPTLALAASLVLAAACGSPATAPSDPVVGDSAGVRIVEYPSDGDHPVSHRPVLDSRVSIGEVTGTEPYLFSEVVGALGLAGGEIVVADELTRELRWFDADGQHVRTVGGHGEGPGEFLAIRLLERLRGDTLAVWDPNVRRVSLFTRSGEHAGSYSPPPLEESFEAPPGTLIPPGTQLRAMLSDGSLLAEPPIVYLDVDPGVRRDSVPLLLFERRQGEWKRIGPAPATEYFYFEDSEAETGLPLPFGRRARMATAGDHVVLGSGVGTTVSLLQEEKLRLRLNPGFEPPPLHSEEIAADRRDRLDRAEGRRAHLARVLDAVPYPDRKPPFANILGGENEIWIEETPELPDSEAARWHAFDLEGRRLATVLLPAELRVTDISIDRVVGVVSGDLGVQRVVTFGLERTR